MKRDNPCDGVCYVELRRTKLERLNNPVHFIGEKKCLPKVGSYLYFKGTRRCKDTLEGLGEGMSQEMVESWEVS